MLGTKVPSTLEWWLYHIFSIFFWFYFVSLYKWLYVLYNFVNYVFLLLCCIFYCYAFLLLYVRLLAEVFLLLYMFVLCIISNCVLCMCVCKCVPYYCLGVSTQLQLSVYHIISYRIVSYIIIYHILILRVSEGKADKDHAPSRKAMLFAVSRTIRQKNNFVLLC
jgi:hypothetical protein